MVYGYLGSLFEEKDNFAFFETHFTNSSRLLRDNGHVWFNHQQFPSRCNPSAPTYVNSFKVNFCSPTFLSNSSRNPAPLTILHNCLGKQISSSQIRLNHYYTTFNYVIPKLAEKSCFNKEHFYHKLQKPWLHFPNPFPVWITLSLVIERFYLLVTWVLKGQ